jgi:protein-S-isoprenylcysteine O-methyltransferase Ste14
VAASGPAADTPGVIAPPPVIALATLLIGLALDWLFPAYVLAIVLTLHDRLWLGGIVFAAGAILASAAMRTFVWAGTPVGPWHPTLNLVTIGIYRYLRNPIYVGLGLMTAGVGIACASDWTLVLILPAAIVMHRGVVLREERYLEAKFGDAYRAYKEAVPRYGWPF